MRQDDPLRIEAFKRMSDKEFDAYWREREREQAELRGLLGWGCLVALPFAALAVFLEWFLGWRKP